MRLTRHRSKGGPAQRDVPTNPRAALRGGGGKAPEPEMNREERVIFTAYVSIGALLIAVVALMLAVSLAS